MESEIIPVNVKAISKTEASSLKNYKEKFGDKINFRVRFSLNNLKLVDDLLIFPLILADEATRLKKIAMKKNQ